MLVCRPMASSRQSSRPARAVAAILLASVCLLAVEPCAFAQTDDDRAGARVAATEGVKASNEKRWADAADLFTRAEISGSLPSASFVPGPRPGKARSLGESARELHPRHSRASRRRLPRRVQAST